MPAIVNIFSWVEWTHSRIIWSASWKNCTGCLFQRRKWVMNGYHGCCDCHCQKHHSSSPWSEQGLQSEAWQELSPTSCDGCEGCGTLCKSKWNRGRKITPRIKLISLQKCWPHWAETRLAKAPRVVSFVRNCSHVLCPRVFFCFTRCVLSQCYTAASGHGLACCSFLCLSCREDFCHHWGQRLAASKSSCTNDSCLSHLSPCQEQPVFSQGRH